jgi:glutamate synthase domain-containing protein 2/NAD-dependent dihydropyrimidine dehydrogenase PreA subunit
MSLSSDIVRPAPSRFLHAVPKYRVTRSEACINCGRCAQVCVHGVHERTEGHNRMRPPVDYRCIGFACAAGVGHCLPQCPRGALTLELNPMYETLGDVRWTADMITATWIMAETGRPPERQDLEYRTGNSGGGFDKLRLRFPRAPQAVDPAEISTSLELNRSRAGGARVTIATPVYGGGMSFGSVSLATMTGKARMAAIVDTFTCTGEGGYPDCLYPYDDHVITQVATGLFGVREETIQRVKIVEFKYAQGAKPGLGGHLLGTKVTQSVARMREAVVGSPLFSPFPFHSVYSIEDHKKHIDWIKAMNPRALVSVKVSTPNDVDMVAVGSYYAGAHIIHIDGGYGGTGAAPDIAKKNIAMPIEYAIPKVHRFLKEEGIRDGITLIASGGIRNVHDLAKAICLGADGAVIGTAEMVALECVRCGNCESGRGCARGIASTDSELADLFGEEWATRRLVNLYHAWNVELVEILRRCGLRDVSELVGRTDLLEHVDYGAGAPGDAGHA